MLGSQGSHALRKPHMEHSVSKSSFKAKARGDFREVESTSKELVVTAPCSHDRVAALRAFRGTVIRYADPLEPVGQEDWEALR